MRDFKQSPLKLGILGCGSFVQRRILPVLNEIDTIKVVCLQKRDLTAGKEIALKFNIPHTVTTREDLLNHPDVEAVFIATPSYLHEDDAIACAKALKPTLCEKPLAPTVQAILRMQEQFTQYAVPLYVGHSLRFKPCVQEAKRLLQSGSLGTLLNFRAYFSVPIPQENWRHTKVAGGGVLQDVGVHLIDLIRFITQAEITSIFVIANSDYGTSNKADQTIAAVCRLNNGAIASFECSFIQPFLCGFEITGTESRLISDYSLRQPGPDSPSESFYHIQKDDKKLHLPIKSNNIYVDELIHFTEILAGKTPPLISINEALQNQKIIEAGYLSIKEGKLVQLNI